MTAGQRRGASAGAVPSAKSLTTQRVWSTWRPCRQGERTARCPSWKFTRKKSHATPPRVLPRAARARVPFPGPLRGTLRDRPPGASRFGNLGPPPFMEAPFPPRLCLSFLSFLHHLLTSLWFRFSATLVTPPLSAGSAPSPLPLPTPGLWMRVTCYPRA